LTAEPRHQAGIFMKTILPILAALALAPVALAAPPAAPVVTVGASHIKQLQFDWPAVPEAGRYELWFRASPVVPWVKYTETTPQRPLYRITVSVHLLDWRVARYRVAACNASGCTNSAEVGVDDLALDAVGYLKQNNAGEGRWFGQSVAMSADGKTAAVVMADSAGTSADNGVVYLYRKASSSAPWRFEAKLRPSVFRRNSSQPYSSRSTLAVNGDGTLVAFGRFFEGIGGQSANGAVYLFRRNGTTWTQEIRLASGVANDWFGHAVDLDDTGNTLAIWRRASSAAGYGVTEIYHHTSAGWQPTATLRVPAAPVGNTHCEAQVLSGDGNTLLRNCGVGGTPTVLVHNAPGWAESARIHAGDNTELDTNFDGTLFVARRNAAFADVYRLQQNVWSPDSGSPLNIGGDPSVITHLYTSISMSRDGKFIAAGDGEDARGTVGPNYPPIPANETGSRGSVYVFERKSSGWTLRRLMKPSVATSTSFGLAVALGADGKNMIVGAVDDASAATRINGNPADASAPSTGAAWLY
jgi:hypothetical protein